MKPLTLLLIPFLAGCPQADILEGKSPAKAHYESMALVTPVVASVAEPVVEPVALVEPEPEPCHEVFRVTRCVDGVAQNWSM